MAPSISLQVFCGIGCLKKAGKLKANHIKTWYFSRFSWKMQERDQKRHQETPEVRKWTPKVSKSEPKGAKRDPKGSQRATEMHPKIDLRKRSRKGCSRGGGSIYNWESFWALFHQTSMNKSMQKSMPKKAWKLLKRRWENGTEIDWKSI